MVLPEGVSTAQSSTILTYKLPGEVLPGTVIIGGSNTVTTTASSGTVLVHDAQQIALKRDVLGREVSTDLSAE